MPGTCPCMGIIHCITGQIILLSTLFQRTRSVWMWVTSCSPNVTRPTDSCQWGRGRWYLSPFSRAYRGLWIVFDFVDNCSTGECSSSAVLHIDAILEAASIDPPDREIHCSSPCVGCSILCGSAGISEDEDPWMWFQESMNRWNHIFCTECNWKDMHSYASTLIYAHPIQCITISMFTSPPANGRPKDSPDRDASRLWISDSNSVTPSANNDFKLRL